MKQKRNRLYYIPYGVVSILFVIATIYDYPIAEYLYHPTSIFALFFERIVLIFVIFLIPFSFYGLYRIRKQVIWLLCYAFSSVYWVIDSVHYWMSISANMYVMIALVILVLGSSYYLLHFVSTSFFLRFERFFSFFLLVFLSAMAITFLWKTLWGRVRYREMLHDVSLFTPWFMPQGFTGYNSFPSGHTTALCSILCFLEVHRVTSYKMPRNKLLCCGIVLLIVMMMVSRMMLGAHFLSDVCMGFTITYTMYLFWKHRIYREELS